MGIFTREFVIEFSVLLIQLQNLITLLLRNIEAGYQSRYVFYQQGTEVLYI